MLGEMAVTEVQEPLAAIRDKKTTAQHLSSAGRRLCWDNTSDAEHAAGLLKMAVNDPYEICFGAMTGHVQYYGKIGLKNSGGIIQVRVNGDLSCGFDTGCKNKNHTGVGNIS